MAKQGCVYISARDRSRLEQIEKYIWSLEFKVELPVEIDYDEDAESLKVTKSKSRYLVTVRPDSELEDIKEFLIKKGCLAESKVKEIKEIKEETFATLALNKLYEPFEREEQICAPLNDVLKKMKLGEIVGAESGLVGTDIIIKLKNDKKKSRKDLVDICKYLVEKEYIPNTSVLWIEDDEYVLGNGVVKPRTLVDEKTHIVNNDANTEKYSLGFCPYCDGQGLLFVAKDANSKPYIVCDETYHEFDSMQDVETKKLRDCPLNLDHNYVSLDEAIKLGYRKYIYVFKNNKWEKLN